MSNDVIKAVREHLSRTGFPFELQVARVLRAHRFEVSHHEHYVDPETGVTREIDLIAEIRGHASKSEVVVVVKLLIECKWSGDTPWILVTADDSRPAARSGGNTQTNELGATILTNAPSAVSVSPFWRGPGPTAFSTLTMPRKHSGGKNDRRTDGETAPIDIAKACRALGLTYHTTAGEPSFRDAVLRGLAGGDLAEIWCPVVVMKGTLTTAWLNDGDEIEVEHTSPWGRLRVMPPRVSSETLVDVVTLDGLPTYLHHIGRDVEGIARAIDQTPEIARDRMFGIQQILSKMADGNVASEPPRKGGKPKGPK